MEVRDKVIKVRASLIEMWKRTVKPDEHTKVYNNGANNLYPNEMERVILNSPTAKRCAAMLSKYIAGQGISEKDIIVNKKNGLRLTDIIKASSRSIAYQNGFYLHVGYGVGSGGVFEPNSLSVLDYVKCRISKEDDEDNPNKIVFQNFEDAEKTLKEKMRGTQKKKEEGDWFYPYNRNQDVIKAQVNADADGETDVVLRMKKYRGQVLYVNLTPEFKYAISKFDAVFNECDTEYRMTLYSNSITRGGFLGKVAVLTQGFDELESQKIQDDVQAWLGAENASHIYHLDVERAEKLEDVLKIIKVESQYDDDMFVNLDKRIRRNITGAANNIPEPLIYSGDGAMFGTQGETYREYKGFYTEQTHEEREIIEKTLAEVGFPVTIIPLDYEDEPDADDENDENDEENENEENVDESNTDENADNTNE